MGVSYQQPRELSRGATGLYVGRSLGRHPGTYPTGKLRAVLDLRTSDVALREQAWGDFGRNRRDWPDGVPPSDGDLHSTSLNRIDLFIWTDASVVSQK